jgi:hypothetical protein
MYTLYLAEMEVAGCSSLDYLDQHEVTSKYGDAPSGSLRLASFAFF